MKLGLKYVKKIENDPEGLPAIYLDFIIDTMGWSEEAKTLMWKEIKKNAGI